MFANKKSAADKWVVERVCDSDLFGHSGVVLEGDGEPALVQVQSAIKERRTHSTICQNLPAYNPQSNGSAESSTRSYVSGTGNENSSGPALGHHREDRLEGTGMDGRRC